MEYLHNDIARQILEGQIKYIKDVYWKYVQSGTTREDIVDFRNYIVAGLQDSIKKLDNV